MANEPIVSNLGSVSAYLDAVAHGFNGTREEFGALLANGASYYQRAESAAQNAERDANTAQNAAGAAGQSAQVATNAAGTAYSAAQSASADAATASTAAGTATTAADNASSSASAAATSANNAGTFATNADLSAQEAAATLESAEAVIEAKGAAVEAEVDGYIADAQAAIDTLEAQKDTIAQTVASMAQLGTDTTLTTTGMAADAEAVGDKLGEQSEAIDTVVCRNNLMGNDLEYYPVDIAAGGKFTVSTSDGSIFPTDSTLVVYLYNSSKTRIDYFSLKNGATSRTITTSSSKGKTSYLRFNQIPNVPLMVNYGDTALSYEKYFNVLNDMDKIRNNIVSDEAIVNSTHNYIDYGQSIYGNIITSAYGNGNFLQEMNIVTVDYDGTSEADLRLRLNEGIVLTNSTNGVAGWTTGLTLKNGYKYEATIKLLSGISTQIPTFAIYKKGSGTASSSTVETTSTYKKSILIADSSEYNFVMYIPRTAVITNARFLVILEELGEATFDDEINDTLAKIRTIANSPSLIFPWVADIHRYSPNADGVQTFDKMMNNMKQILGSVKCDFILNTGDLTDGADKETTTIQVNTCVEQFLELGIPYVWTHGNHDTNYDEGASYVFTIPEIYAKYFSATRGTDYNANTNGTDYYIDFPFQKVRLVVIDANQPGINTTLPNRYAYDENTVTWLATALNTANTVIVCVHQSPIVTQVYNNTSTTNASGIVSALQTFVNNGGNLIMLSGHSHLDVAFISPWLSIMQDCQRFSNIEETITDEDHSITGYIDNVRKNARTANTYTEDCWTMCVYKPIENEFDLIRFGAGIDRYFHVTPISPDTLTTRLSGTITWSSSDTSVATVSSGVVTGVGTGKCAILAKDENSNYECWIVEVT